jgi:UDP:flavonoid glycosyltransferase YjiC (YdhE family)
MLSSHQQVGMSVNQWHDIDMARFLFVMLPLESHHYPALAIAAELERAGHAVAWCGPESDLRPLAGPDAVIYPTGKRRQLKNRVTGADALRSLWQDYLLPVNRFIREPADAAVADWRPDVVVADQYALAGAVAAYRHKVCWATLSTGVLELTPPPLPWLPRYIREQLSQMWEAVGLPPVSGLDLRFSPDLVIFLTSRELIGPVPLPAQTVLTGPAIGQRPVPPGGQSFSWTGRDARQRHVLVTVGTLLDNLDDRGTASFYARIVSALAPMAGKLQAVLIAPPAAVPDPPPHVLVRSRVPVLQLLPTLDAVVCHSGMGTVSEALLHGIPLVVAPVAVDQMVVAKQVTNAGVGIEVSFADATPAELGTALETVLTEPGYPANARRVGESLRAAGGAPEAARHLAALADTVLADKGAATS